jgi:hypothetical protein
MAMTDEELLKECYEAMLMSVTKFDERSPAGKYIRNLLEKLKARLGR